MPTLPVRDIVYPSVLRGQSNGRLPDSILVSITAPGGGAPLRLVEPAARSFAAMIADAARAGYRLMATGPADSYRAIAVQERVFRERYVQVIEHTDIYWDGHYWRLQAGAPAAIPGTSNHGWGLAVDLAEQRDGDAAPESLSPGAIAWLVANAWRFGISAELQAESWHWRKYDGDNLTPAVRAYIEGDDMAVSDEDADKIAARVWARGASSPSLGIPMRSYSDWIKGGESARQVAEKLRADLAADQTRDAAILAAIQALSAVGGVDAAPIVAAVREEAEGTRALVAELQAALETAEAERDNLRDRLADALGA